jgi:hypothetical protein
VRFARRFTPRERNDFYLAPEPLHGLERLGFTVAGMAIGAFAVWAPFIPLWQKEWVLPFAVAGLDSRASGATCLRRYQADLNGLVARPTTRSGHGSRVPDPRHGEESRRLRGRDHGGGPLRARLECARGIGETGRRPAKEGGR